jgi:delta(3,5)-delta(2,4)-dienoyl-CoA isomerase
MFSNEAPRDKYKFETLKVTSPNEFVYHVEINRPDKRNAMNQTFWGEIRECFHKIADDSDCRVAVLSGAGKCFTAGLDLNDAGMAQHVGMDVDIARKAYLLKKTILQYQESFSSIEKCPKIVIAAIHNFCLGAGVDLIAACDIRYCTKDSSFQIKEVDVGLAADVGTLQRLPKIVGNDSAVRELAVTARMFFAEEADKLGLVSQVFPDKDAMQASVLETAKLIASKSPVAVQGTKVNLNYSRDHPTDQALHFQAHYNMCMLQSEDLLKSMMALMSKSTPEFSKL